MSFHANRPTGNGFIQVSPPVQLAGCGECWGSIGNNAILPKVIPERLLIVFFGSTHARAGPSALSRLKVRVRDVRSLTVADRIGQTQPEDLAVTQH